MWPSMVKLVKEKEIGTAYGLMYSVQNLGLWGVPILAGLVLDRTNPGIAGSIELYAYHADVRRTQPARSALRT